MEPKIKPAGYLRTVDMLAGVLAFRNNLVGRHNAVADVVEFAQLEGFGDVDKEAVVPFGDGGGVFSHPRGFQADPDKEDQNPYPDGGRDVFQLQARIPAPRAKGQQQYKPGNRPGGIFPARGIAKPNHQGKPYGKRDDMYDHRLGVFAILFRGEFDVRSFAHSAFIS